ncbi:MAG: hypothetical protein ACOVP4_01285 [Bacteriovoracaceae bacterium]
MKNGSKTKTYSVIAALLLLASCNEKVNPSLQDSNTTTTPPPAMAAEQYFRVVNTSDTLLDYHLHKTGPGNFNSKCEVTAPAFSTALYAGVPSTYDVTCFFEAEELALFFNGLEWKVESSANTCEYIGYTPFSFHQYQPGNSTRTIVQNTCQPGAVTPTATGLCDRYYQQNALIAALPNTTAPIIGEIADDEELCRFDYSEQDGPNCDDGVITIIKNDYSPDPDAPGTNLVSSTTTKINCGGKAVNCINGPIKDVASLSEFSVGTEITKANFNQAMSLPYEVSSPISKDYLSNMYASNYMRQCSGVNYDNDTYDIGAPLLGFNPTQTTFNSTLIDLLSKNWRRGYDHTNLGTRLFDYSDSSVVNPARFSAQNEVVRPYANSPHSGRSIAGSNTSPFYNFYCLNKAQDVKARIRIVVREWDRAFAVDPIMEVMSDVYNNTDSLMDNSFDELGNLDIFDSFNDKADWDDFLLFLTPVDDVVPTNDIPACQIPYQHSLESFSRSSFPEGSL